METVLIVLVVLLLLGGGGWGYSRWRGWRRAGSWPPVSEPRGSRVAPAAPSASPSRRPFRLAPSAQRPQWIWRGSPDRTTGPPWKTTHSVSSSEASSRTVACRKTASRGCGADRGTASPVTPARRSSPGLSSSSRASAPPPAASVCSFTWGASRSGTRSDRSRDMKQAGRCSRRR